MDKIGILRRKETWSGGREFFLTCAYSNFRSKCPNNRSNTIQHNCKQK
jgi:hypothetical protein